MQNAPTPNVGPALGTAMDMASNAQINALYALLDDVKKLRSMLNSSEVHETYIDGKAPAQKCSMVVSFRAHPDEINAGLLPELLRDSLRQADLIADVKLVVDDLLKIFG